jgi:hypothetical protein
VAKSAAFKVNAQHQALYDNSAAMRAWYARQVLNAAAEESLNPQLRAMREAATRKDVA